VKLIPRLFRRKEAPRNDIASSYELLQYLDSYARESAAGIRVNRNEALKCPTVAVSVKVISESVAQLPFNVFRVDKDGGRRVIDSNPAHKLLSQHGRPNSRQSAFEFKRWATREVALCGNAYALKQYVGDSLDALIPITRPVQVEENALGALVYRVARKDGTKAVYGQQDIFHLRGESDDCVTGIDPIKQNAEAIGLALAQDRFAAKMSDFSV
jgi:HK97 family phage portal protein